MIVSFQPLRTRHSRAMASRLPSPRVGVQRNRTRLADARSRDSKSRGILLDCGAAQYVFLSVGIQAVNTRTLVDFRVGQAFRTCQSFTP